MLTASLWILGGIVGIFAYLNTGYQWGLARKRMWLEGRCNGMLELISFPLHCFSKTVGQYSSRMTDGYPWVIALVWPFLLLWGILVGVVPYFFSRGFVTGPRLVAAKALTVIVAYRARWRERRVLAGKSFSRLEVLATERERLLAEREKLDMQLDVVDGELAGLLPPYRGALPPSPTAPE